MEENNTVTKDMSDHIDISMEVQFLLLAMSRTEYKIGEVFVDSRQPSSQIITRFSFFGFKIRVCVPRATQFFAINEKWLLVRSMNWFFSFCVYFLQAA